MDSFIQSDKAQEMREYTLPRFHELPKIQIYLDQLITVLQQILSPLFDADTQQCMTASMINNYAKQGVISRPVKKKYTRDHIAYLIFIAASKQVLSIDGIRKLIQIQLDSYPLEAAYDYFCTELENALHAVFNGAEPPADTASTQTQQTKLMRADVSAIAHKIYLSKYLEQFAAQQAQD
ncbi:MAG: DUF1836 domain-containing protein [Butyricicoccus porcorum]|nr:DUF1836 domain-containing protein [Butyricicoccus porcorum]MDD6986682.1 DUF1836 domain-containing protein [Butyricicoccus porcorum]MDY4482479.1 DUF1836 domain-containing protein [Butyricicoccus porcorum]